MKILPCVLLFLALCGLPGCQSVSPLPLPMPTLACEPDQSSLPDPWWQGFDDQGLSKLLVEAHHCNLDLQKKALEIQRFRLESAESDLRPEGEFSLRSQQGVRHGGGGRQRTSGLSLSVAYEVDVWQRQARRHDVAAWKAVAGTEELRALKLSLDADVAIAYWQQQAFTSRIELARDQQQIGRQMLAHIRAAVDAGAEPARAFWLQQQVTLQAGQRVSLLVRARQRAGLHLAALLEHSVPTSAPAPAVLDGPMPAVMENLPADLLLRRPDLAARQARLQGFTAARQLARASFMPKLTLTSTFGSVSPALGQLLSQPVASVLASLAMPFLDWHNLSLARDQAGIDYQSAVLDYRHRALQALSEAHDALSWRQQLLQQDLLLRQNLRLAQALEREAGWRVNLGEDSPLLLLQARLRHSEAIEALIELQLEQRTNLAILYKVLGGAYSARDESRPVAG
jgi:outer membrane protein TolC